MRKRVLLKYLNDEYEVHIAKAKKARDVGDQAKLNYEFGAACAFGNLRMWVKLGYLDTKYIEEQKKEQNGQRSSNQSS